ncbi:unnamed protein product [Symbiodinium natans]|uniref:Uncharacterized protein n=1 Tax=Symbiodinium natans TaxID=878477 RepID=A0A812KWM0_9DINO|nr:unnamed protein product [Symbiodinium natans]
MVLSSSIQSKPVEFVQWVSQLPRPLGAVGKSQGHGEKPHKVIKLADIDDALLEQLTQSYVNFCFASHFLARPHAYEGASLVTMLEGDRRRDKHTEELSALAALMASESRAGRFTCLSTPPEKKLAQFSTTSPSLPQSVVRPPPGLERPVSPHVAGDPQACLELRGQAGKSARKAGRRFMCRFVFHGFDAARHADFDLVPRIIGRRCANLRPIRKACNGYIRVNEMNNPVEVVLRCETQQDLDEGIKQLTTLLDDLCKHFSRYCRKQGINPVPELYHLLP